MLKSIVMNYKPDTRTHNLFNAMMVYPRPPECCDNLQEQRHVSNDVTDTPHAPQNMGPNSHTKDL